MRYPTFKPASLPGSGSAIYLYLLENIAIPSRLPHLLWYGSQEKKLNDEHDPFKGFFPIGKTYEIDYAGKGMGPYKFTGKEKNAVYVKDCSDETLMKLGIRGARPDEKVFNPNFVSYDDLPKNARLSNETATMSLAKSLSAYLCGIKGILYTEQDVVEMMIIAIREGNSEQMKYILHGNHVSWCAARYIETGIMEEDVKKQFYAQTDTDFFMKDIGTIMPGILYTLALLGVDPTEAIKEIGYDVWGIEEVAAELKKYMKAEIDSAASQVA